ncbi:PLP-dependent aminotransferase family protein [Myxococcus sp. K15C18031901]|uniref:aminotransferase-like domain-containing protein n=1 Tax=Myxococcus dinghuensis TaxID=2906761 RepID=UPI0020A7198D|nr:PLP-dependent aminotransferase family protein [Myxococcus dinghuensis]MCP3103783.1 PLP-dependent aminotransferase family protein [Myxococcus dinghuensis]
MARTKYERLAAELERQISSNLVKPGERLSSVRELSRVKRVGLNTAVRALALLEDRGLIVSKPQSGFYVLGPRTPPGVSSPPMRLSVPQAVQVPELVSTLFESAKNREVLPLGAACLSAELYPNEAINRMTRRVVREQPRLMGSYALPPGDFEYRRQVSRRLERFGTFVAPADIVATNGAMESLGLALRATCAPGDTVLIESPQYFGILQALQHLRLKVVELPAHPVEGIRLEQVEEVLSRRDIAAGLFTPNFSNPMGTLMSDEKKAALVALFARHDVPLIEDDIYAELSFQQLRPRPLRAFDTRGGVLTCASFSKTVSPGLKVGWLAPGRHLEKVQALQLASSMGGSPVSQRVMASYLASKEYERNLRELRLHCSVQVERFSRHLLDHFPEGTRTSQPKGGFVLWVELPKRVDSVELYRRALAEGISLSPGTLFSTRDLYRHYIRLNCGNVWSPKLEQGLTRLGRLATTLARARPS